MRRILPVVAALIAAGVLVAAIIELDSRSDDETLAIPTLGPSLSPSAAGPTLPPRATARPSPRSTPKPTAKAAVTPAATTPEPSFSRTPKPQPTPERTAPAPRTPTPSPEPTLPVGPIDRSNGPTPRTGADPVPAGVGIAIGAIALRRVLRAGRRSY